MNQQYWSSRIQGLVPYTPGEQPKDRTFIKLNTNENPYPPSPRVLEAIQREADQRLRLYPDPESAALRGALAEHYGVEPEQVLQAFLDFYPGAYEGQGEGHTIA